MLNESHQKMVVSQLSLTKSKNGGKNYSRNVQERINRKGASKEVVVKISGGAITRQGIRNSIDYMSRDSELPVMSESGRVWTGDEILEAKEHMIDRANDPQHVMNDKGKENKKNHTEYCLLASSFSESKA